jgi:hypothetical protein
MKGGSWWNDVSTGVSSSLSNANTNVGERTYKKFICEAPYRGARAMSSAYTVQQFSKVIDCKRLTKEQKELFNSWQNQTSACGDSFRCKTAPDSPKQPRFYVSSDGAGQQPPEESFVDDGTLQGGRKTRRFRGGSRCSRYS